MKYTGRIGLILVAIIFSLTSLFIFNEPFRDQMMDTTIAIIISWFIGLLYDKSVYLQKKFEQQSYELNHSKKALEDILDNVDAMLWIEDLQVGNMLVSKGTGKIFGFKPVDFSQNPQLWFERVHPEDKSKLSTYYKHLLSGQIREAIEFRIIRSNDEVIWVEARTTPIFDQDGKVVKQTGVITDISKRKKLESQLKESEEQYRKLVEYSPIGIAIHEFGEIRYVNPAGTKKLGATSMKDIVGKNILDFIHPDYHEQVKERWEIIRWDKKPVEYQEEKIIRLDHQIIDVEIIGLPVTINGEELVQLFFKDITDRKRAQNLIHHLAYHDPLTGLPNRRYFQDQLIEELVNTKAYKKTLSVMFLDLDGFKKVNDELGHDVGDLLLHGFAERLKTCVREKDILSRLGGDEFTILLPDIYEEDAVRVAERIIGSLKTPFEINGKEIKVTTSIGISFYPNGEYDENLMKYADLAMYIAKQKGKNTYHIYEEYH